MKIDQDILIWLLEKMNLYLPISWLQSSTNYLRLTLIFMWNSALREKFIFCFSCFFASIISIIFILAGGWALGYHVMGFWDFPDIASISNSDIVISNFASLKSFGNSWGNWYILCFFTDNRASFYLRRKENLLKYQKVSKYYENDCNFKKILKFNLTVKRIEKTKQRLGRKVR